MNSLIIVIVSIAFFSLAYWFYARKLESLWQIDPKRPTPALTKFDSVDFVPAKNWLVVFGHHFASIAGAGPIIGPVIAVMLWGWLPALLWVIVGTIFFGAVHDFGALAASVKEGGSSVADIAEHVISRRAKILFSLFVWFALILVIAVFAYLCADTFVKEPKIILPSLGLIPVAMVVGYLLYHLRINSVLATILGLLALAGLIILGNTLAIQANINTWLAVLLIYSYFASILPVNLLLQPRDYLSSFLLIFGIVAGYLGIFIARPNMIVPGFRAWNSQGGCLWPAMFVTVACGAISGFHALIASGTTSKQIANERHIKRVGFGGMITESLVAVLAIISAVVLLGSRRGIGIGLKNASPIAIFSDGFGMIARNILGGHGTLIAITILNAFILTTLDTATRVSRYLTEELFGIKNRYFSTLIIIILSSTLAFSGQWQKIWPIFGASNQLVAALALFVLSCWLLSKKKAAGYTLWPAIFMLITTVAALMLQAIEYSRKSLAAMTPSDFRSGYEFIRSFTIKNNNIVLLAITAVLLTLAVFMVIEVIKVFFRRNNAS